MAQDIYRGNPLLKKSNTKQGWTSEQIEEYKKCYEDPIYFIETYVKIVHLDRGLVPFELYEYQHEIINSLHENRYTILATGRQIGKSITTGAYILWYIIFNSRKNVAILANKAATAREILDRIQAAYMNLPMWLQHGVVTFNKGTFKLDNGSQVMAASSSSSAIRGFSINFLMVDECAFVPNFEEFFASVFPTISSGKTTKAVLVSTPNGLNHFYKIYNDAVNNNNDYNPITVTWDKVPGRNEEWKNNTIRGLGNDMEKFGQEHCVEFLGSSGTLISGWKLKQLTNQIPIHQDEHLKVYERPDNEKMYMMVCDVSRGKGLDYSAFSVFDILSMPYKQVATYRTNLITPTDYANYINNIGRYYNYAQVLVEVNDIGAQVSDLLFYDYDYEYLLKTQSKGRNGKTIVNWAPPGKADKGIRTTTSVKRTGCSILKLLIEQNQLIINDFQTIQELSTFSQKGNSYEAEAGKHDDMVMGLVLFAWASTQTYFRDMTDSNTLQALRDQTKQEIDDYLLPFGIVDDGISVIGNREAVNWF